MGEISTVSAGLLLLAGLVSGCVNTLAGGGSLLTVPLLVMLGLPGTLANGTNRVGILIQSLVASWRFRRQGVLALRDLAGVAVPVGAGALAGALWIARVADETFERAFGVAMLVLLVPTLRELGRPENAPAPRRAWRPAVRHAVFAAIGLYLGALQAGVGLPLLAALLHSGHDVVRGNALKVAVIALASAVAVPVFVWQGQVAWGPALLLAAGFAAGGELGARLTLARGARVVRPVLAVAVLALAARLLGLI